jgi:glycosyltransferase involved in cell wall biosynthesis
MDNMTIIIPFWNGNKTIQQLVNSIPCGTSIIIVVDHGSEECCVQESENIAVIHLSDRGYFSGACNEGMSATKTDVLILNQDSRMSNGWDVFIDTHRKDHDMIGDGVFGHPAWPNGYIQGTFMYISRKAINEVGYLSEKAYPLWGATCEYQLRVCRSGMKAKPCSSIPGYEHERGSRVRYGSAITTALRQEPSKKNLFIKTPPEISVIVPCYNYGEFVVECVQSILNQTYQDTEIIIVDDFSTDDSWEVCQSLASGWNGIRAIQNEKNVGTAATYNAGIKRSFGRYITAIDADDMMQPQRLERLYSVAQNNPGRFVYDDAIFRSDNGDSVKQMGDYNFSALLHRNFIHTGILYPKQAWIDAGGYPEIMSDGRQDWAFNIALGRAGWHGVHIQEPLYINRRHGRNRTLRNTTPWHINHFREKIKRLYPDVFEGLDDFGLPGSSGMAQLCYLGSSCGSQRFWGASGQYYDFSTKSPVKYVAAQDVEGLLSLGRKDKSQAKSPLFERVG